MKEKSKTKALCAPKPKDQSLVNLGSSRHVREISQAIDQISCQRSTALYKAGTSASQTARALGVKDGLNAGAHGEAGGYAFEKRLLNVTAPPIFNGKKRQPLFDRYLKHMLEQHGLYANQIVRIDASKGCEIDDYESRNTNSLDLVSKNWAGDDTAVVMTGVILSSGNGVKKDWIRPDVLVRLPGHDGFCVCEIKGFVQVNEDQKDAEIQRAIQQCAISAVALMSNLKQGGYCVNISDSLTPVLVIVACRAIGKVASLNLLHASDQIAYIASVADNLYCKGTGLDVAELDVTELDNPQLLEAYVEQLEPSYRQQCHGCCSLSEYCASQAVAREQVQAFLPRTLPKNLVFKDLFFSDESTSSVAPDRLEAVEPTAKQVVIEPRQVVFGLEKSGLSLQELRQQKKQQLENQVATSQTHMPNAQGDTDE